MYRLDLSAPQLNLPVAFYRASEQGAGRPFVTRQRKGAIALFALERAGPRTVGCMRDGKALKAVPPMLNGLALLHAIPANAKPPVGTVPLYEFLDERSGMREYSTERELNREGFLRSADPICHVRIASQRSQE